MPESDFHHVRRVMAFVAQMFSAGKVDNAFIVLKSGDRLHGQLRGTTVGNQDNSVKLLIPSGRILSVDMREIRDIGCGNPT